MDKTSLRNTLSTLTPTNTIEVLFRNEALQAYTVTGTRRGRGKGGPPIVSLTDASGGVRELTAAMNENVLMLVLSDGSILGSENPTDSPRTFEVDVVRGATYKALLIEKGVAAGAVVQLSSTPEAPELTGTFVVESASKVRGCHGQVRLTLRNADDPTARVVEFYTHRHSSVVTSLEVLSVPATTPAVTDAPEAVTTEAVALSEPSEPAAQPRTSEPETPDTETV